MRPLTALVLALSVATPAAAVDPGFRAYLDEFPFAPPLQRVVFAINSGAASVASLTAEGYPDGATLMAARSWTFAANVGDEHVVQTAPVSAAWSCYVPSGCGGLFDPAASDYLVVGDNLTTPPTRDVAAIEFDGIDTFFVRAQIVDEGGANEGRVCLADDVPFVVFPNLDGTRRYLTAGDPPWSSAVFPCIPAATANGPCGVGGTVAYISDGNGTDGLVTGRVAQTGTLSLPSGHVVDAALVETYSSFEAYGAKLFGNCALPVSRLRAYALAWMVPHYGTLVQVLSDVDLPDLASFTNASATSIGYGLLPPVAITVDAVGADFVTVSWDPGILGANAADDYVVHWGPLPGAGGPPPNTAIASSTSYTISGLVADTQICVSVTSRKSYTDPVSGVSTRYESIALPQSIGADIDGDGSRDASYPPEVCVLVGSSGPTLLRNDTVTDILPVTPALGSILPLDPLTDIYQTDFSPGDLDMETGVLGDPLRPLVCYGLDPPSTIFLAKTPAGRIAITY